MIKIYTQKDIQTIYNRHHRCPGSILCRPVGSNNNSWVSPPIDTGKWPTSGWEFCFIVTEQNVMNSRSSLKLVQDLEAVVKEYEDIDFGFK